MVCDPTRKHLAKLVGVPTAALLVAVYVCGTATSADVTDGAKPLIGKKAGEVRDDNQLSMKLIWCPPGTFKMGSPKEMLGNTYKAFGYPSRIPLTEKQVEVKLSHGFWMGKYEVTQEEWEGIMGSNPSKAKGERLPVDSITWAEAVYFCDELTKLDRTAGRLPKGWEYRLPTEAEWEYACRAGTTTPFFFGGYKEADTQMFNYGWTGFNSGDGICNAYLGKVGGCRSRRTHPVGKKKASPWGFYDIYGNVGEWTQDWYGQQLPGGTDPVQTQPAPAIDRTIRGKVYPATRSVRGGYYLSPCRSAFRGQGDRDTRFPGNGLRVVLVKTGTGGQGRKTLTRKAKTVP